MLLPGSDDAARLLLVSHALRSEGYVAALESGALRARCFAEPERRPVSFADVRRVMKEAGTHQAIAKVAPPMPRRVSSTAKPSRKLRVMPASDRLPVGALVGVADFTGSRPPG